MRKWLKYILLFLGIYLAMTVVFAVASAYRGNRDAVVKTERVDQSEPEPKPLYKITVSGESMEPILKNGDTVSLDTSADPKIGDLIAFSCTGKCASGGVADGIHIIKRLTKIDSRGCYWLQGENTEEYSWDSRSFGYLCPPKDVMILGVVIK